MDDADEAELEGKHFNDGRFPGCKFVEPVTPSSDVVEQDMFQRRIKQLEEQLAKYQNANQRKEAEAAEIKSAPSETAVHVYVHIVPPSPPSHTVPHFTGTPVQHPIDGHPPFQQPHVPPPFEQRFTVTSP